MLRPATGDDAPRISAWLCDPQINRYLTSNLRGQGLSPQLLKVALRRQDLAWYVFSAEDNGDPVGLVALDSIDAADGVANLWFVLGDSSRSRSGLTSKAIREFCDDNPLSLAAVTAWAVELNLTSRGCLIKAGFREIGHIENAVGLPEGRYARVLFTRAMGRTDKSNSG